MKEDFVPYDIAVKLKEKGFKAKCMRYYDSREEDRTYFYWNANTPMADANSMYYSWNKNNGGYKGAWIDAPTISQVLKWLREEKKIFVDVNSFPTYSTKEMVAYAVDVRRNSDGYSMENVESAQSFARWEEAALAGIEYVLDNWI